jgi:hypothetical protein
LRRARKRLKLIWITVSHAFKASPPFPAYRVMEVPIPMATAPLADIIIERRRRWPGSRATSWGDVMG